MPKMRRRFAAAWNFDKFKLLREFGTAFTIIWAICDPCLSFLGYELRHNAVVWYGLLLAPSILWTVLKFPATTAVRWRVANTNTTVSVVFGDLFHRDGIKVIPVNEYFDTLVDDRHVSAKSVHGEFIKRQFPNGALELDRAIDQGLKTNLCTLSERPTGRKQRYEIGTTVCISLRDERYFLLATCKTEDNTLRAHSSVPLLWDALDGLWKFVRNNSSGHLVTVPLIGGGLARVGLPPDQLLRFILLSLVTAVKSSDLGHEVCIVLRDDLVSEIDLNAINREWR